MNAVVILTDQGFGFAHPAASACSVSVTVDGEYCRAFVNGEPVEVKDLRTKKETPK